MSGYASPEPPRVTRVMECLDQYFRALEDGAADGILPDPLYEWRHYQGAMTLERMRTALVGIDDYLWHDQQRDYVRGNTKLEYDAGPGLCRLTDSAMIAMFQDLDKILADTKESGAD